MTDKIIAGPRLGEYRKKVRLETKDGHHVQDVYIPPFLSLPDVLIWGNRTFTFHGELSADGDPCCAEYREAFCHMVLEEARS